MLEYVLVAVVAALVLAWLYRRRRRIFELRLEPSAVAVERGEPPARFLAECREIARTAEVSGRLWAVRAGRSVALHFSDSIDEPLRQRFRNVFPFERYQRGKGPGGDGGRRRAG